MTAALHRCPRCNGSAWWFDREDQSVTAVCLLCAERIFIRDGRAEARIAGDAPMLTEVETTAGDYAPLGLFEEAAG